ncbi:DeoR family transcriptional regulator [Candidatus Wolfebacteria bacterium]|nr:DeoR family transcriptional regulator [Candidatus Wolfebacteria bacterium]
MNNILVFLVGVVAGAGLWSLASRRRAEPALPKEKAKGERGAVGLIRKQEKIKQENINKILAYLAPRAKVANSEVEKLLNVSDATATRYLDELEKKGRVRQIGRTGREVYYEKI